MNFANAALSHLCANKKMNIANAALSHLYANEKMNIANAAFYHPPQAGGRMPEKEFFMYVGKYPIIKKNELAKGIFDFVIHCPEIAQIATPGQFVHISAERFMLRRPISICEIDKKAGTLRLVLEVRGNGTKSISELQTTEHMDIIAPLGNGFTIDVKYENPYVIGGGIGTPPLLELCKNLDNPVAILGFRNKQSVILQNDFEKISNLYICTDEKSEYFHGNAIEQLNELCKNNIPDIIYTCGPAPMLDAAIKFADKHKIPIQVSLEERMACGIGACLVCACKIVKNGKEHYAHVCKDGPVITVDN